MNLNPSLESYLDELQATIESIPDNRKVLLKEIAAFIRQNEQEHAQTDLIFICTHNSRRSHMGQIWAQALAYRAGLQRVKTYSGGTEATAFHPNAIRALRDAGFDISTEVESENPRYQVRFGDMPDATTSAWSKKYDDAANPQHDFGAIMTCSEADEACPLVLGAKVRIALTYQDPKAGDGTPTEAEGYRERSGQIAAELYYMYQQIQA